MSGDAGTHIRGAVEQRKATVGQSATYETVTDADERPGADRNARSARSSRTSMLGAPSRGNVRAPSADVRERSQGTLVDPASDNRNVSSLYMPPTFAEGLNAICAHVAAATAPVGSWSARIDIGLESTLDFLDAHPDWTRVLVLEAPLDGETTSECARRLGRGLEPVLNEAREEVIVGAELRPSPALLAELVALGVMSVVRSKLLQEGTGVLRELAPSLRVHVVAPYLLRGAQRADGLAAARTDGRAEMVPIRPHPRTLQALRVIAAAPRLSTREVGRAIGVETTSGHVSGLLRRLEQRGLIENDSSRRQPRQPSTWFLTPYGHRILEVIANSFASAESADAMLRRRGVR